MDAVITTENFIPANILQPLFIAANSSNLNKALQNLIELAKTTDGRSDLASKHMLSIALQLCQILSYPSCGGTLLLTLKLIRNLCAGEIRNQNSFVEQNGVDIVVKIISSEGIINDSNYGIIRMGLQVLANVSLAGKKQQVVIWEYIYGLKFLEIVKLRRKDICDPLCMIIYACIEEDQKLVDKLCSDHALPLLVEIVRTASAVGFEEGWLKLILSRTCIEESYFTPFFWKLPYSPSKTTLFTQDQLFLISTLSNIINEQTELIKVSKHFASNIFQILKTNLSVLNHVPHPTSSLPTGNLEIDVLGYSLCIIRDVVAFDDLGNFKEDDVAVVDSLVSLGLIEMLLGLLNDLEPPALIRKTLQHDKKDDMRTKVCPYKGFRSDIVAVIGNCAYKRKHVQDEIRGKSGILLMLQQCVVDDFNPFLREWGIWGVRNLLEGNDENQRVVSELEIQGSVNLPELSGLGLRVDVDQQTRRARLVNTS